MLPGYIQPSLLQGAQLTGHMGMEYSSWDRLDGTEQRDIKHSARANSPGQLTSAHICPHSSVKHPSLPTATGSGSQPDIVIFLAG